jgi:hypothetical protein
MMSREPNAPPGWSVNPSAAPQRAPVVVLATVGLVLSVLHVAAVRGWNERLREPFPRIDAGGWLHAPPHPPLPELGLVGFALLLATMVIGPRDRWRSHPALTIASAIAALAVAGSALVRWSLQYAQTAATTSTTFSLLTAIAIACVPLALDELYAAATWERRHHHHHGDVNAPYRSMSHRRIGTHLSDWTGYAAGGAAIILGVALLFAARWTPPVAASHARLLGGVIAAVGALSLAQVTRSLRWVNAAIGAWLLVAPLLHGYSVGGTLQAMIFGFLLLLVSVGLGEADLPAGDSNARVDPSSS